MHLVCVWAPALPCNHARRVVLTGGAVRCATLDELLGGASGDEGGDDEGGALMMATMASAAAVQPLAAFGEPAVALLAAALQDAQARASTPPAAPSRPSDSGTRAPASWTSPEARSRRCRRGRPPSARSRKRSPSGRHGSEWHVR